MISRLAAYIRSIRKNRSWRISSSAKAPLAATVTVLLPGFFTPRMVMHMCSASSATITPRGARCSIIASAICPVICS